MSARLKTLIHERNVVVKEIRDLLTKADTESKGILDAAAVATMAALEEKETSLASTIEAEERQLGREKHIQTIAAGDEPVIIGAGGEERATKEQELRSKAYRAWLIEGDKALNRKEHRDLLAGSVTAGGSMIAPEQFLAQLIKAVDNNVFMRKYATIIQMEKALSLGVPTLDSNPDDPDWTVELATGTTDTGMTTGKRELIPSPLAKQIKVSKKLLQVSAIPVEALVNDRMGYKFGVAQEKAYLTGSGANQPLGVYTATSKGISTGRDVSSGNTTTAITFDGLINALYSLKEQYQNSPKLAWNFHRDAMKMIRKLKDGQGQYLWQVSTQSGQPDTILGKPVFMSEYTPNTFTTGLYVGIIGDFSNYWIAQVNGLEMERLNELYAGTNQVGWIGRMEIDGAPVLEEAFARVALA